MSSHYFIGIKAPPTIKNQVVHYRDTLQLDRQYKVLPVDEDLHITLFFIGALTDQQRDLLNNRLNALAMNIHQFSLSIDGLSYFGSPTGPRVVYLSVEPSTELDFLQQSIAQSVSDLLSIKATNPFIPHITIAKKRKTLESSVIPIEQFEKVHFSAELFSLFTIHPDERPKYEATYSYVLQMK
ncbi:RNA 2',3'-cyclic phosphodiesterase [Sporosarcina sp. Sa2YVA2]|uniref:RNA 2',3'-cyclic phosphodiesterase n=1 Tax=Sporosarcina quadrami TaxID=2762234 RepID=A0ABR8UAN3_9BACL|nr:RNA 2',3'-cyclic phosphodiesterase [Sporosarcina quadrami]MBD7985051.1 RNA 2',3'-cyclic phosphodiesterase [Sporosarcina quadrami]